MLDFLANNWGTFFVGTLVAAIIVAVIVKLVRDKKRGKCVGCDCACSECPSQLQSPSD